MIRDVCEHGTPTAFVCKECQSLYKRWLVIDTCPYKHTVEDLGLFYGITEEEAVSKAKKLWNTESEYITAQSLDSIKEDWTYWL